MKRDLFRRYVWLVDIVRHAKWITYDEISEAWTKSPLNASHAPLALRTFHNHRDAVAQLFGIHILCNRSDHKYFIPDEDRAGSTNLKVWMLQTLSLSNMATNDADIENRIVLDITPEEKHGLMTVIEAMKKNRILALRYSYRLDGPAGNKRDFNLAPYCVRFWRFGWYILGRDMATGELVILALSHIPEMEITKKNFSYPEEFHPRRFFANFYGVDIDSDTTPSNIRLRIGGKTRDRIRVQPLHGSQKEVMIDQKDSVFDLKLVPTPDFKSALMAMGTDVEVLSPASLRAELADTLQKILSYYE